jgi:CRP-like cAMP-binding protein
MPSFLNAEQEIFEIVCPETKEFVKIPKNSKLFTEGEQITHCYMLRQGF